MADRRVRSPSSVVKVEDGTVLGSSSMNTLEKKPLNALALRQSE